MQPASRPTVVASITILLSLVGIVPSSWALAPGLKPNRNDFIEVSPPQPKPKP